MNDINGYRKIASEYFQKELLPDEIVHHIDGNHDNNDPENLVIMKKSQHSKVHAVFNFENWRQLKARILCVDCLFCALYELDNESTIEILYDLAEQMIWNVKKTPHSMDLMYELSKEWIKENNHDCYEHKHMEVVHV